jgi:hypothetical protein
MTLRQKPIKKLSAAECTSLIRDNPYISVQVSADALGSSIQEQQAATQARKPKYRVIHKRAIWSVLIREPNCTDINLCRLLDEDGYELPTNLRKNQDRTFLSAYRDPARKNKIESIFSKVRRDILDCGLQL